MLVWVILKTINFEYMKNLILLLILACINILPQYYVNAADGWETTILIDWTEVDNTAPTAVGDPNDPNFVWPPAPTTPTASSSNNILWVDDADLRKWNVSMDTIPLVLVSIINVLLWVAGTISIVALIYYAVQMQINSGITGDSSWVDNAKRWMKWAILGFIVAILAWFIVIRFVEILSSMS